MQTFGPRQTIQFKPQPLKVIAIGDSLIYGYGDKEGGGWVERLKRRWMYGEREHVLYNLGIRGDRTSQVKERLALEYKYRGELRNRYPDRIIISVGVNDSPRLGRKAGRNLTDYDQFCQDIEELLNQAQQLCPVFFVGMIPVDEDKMPFLDCFYYNRRDQYRYKEATKQACAERNIPYLDTFDLWTSRGENWIKNHLCEDGLHPNVQGYQSLYDDITQWQPLQLMVEKYPS
ncbi:lipolytic protein G-D-S-L family [Cyanobacterium stanieri PCC 7202]|uniref:Lipolytic protein G-D-S-L family n=1 Tax=Cyanobacterium stanieri (strain ATCC 29140 / PCC 7202) TaxID=292563 RepID=K9YR66_CYASC|nr:lipolytic protein G-D-S-L family [Cyanobacterium stanieri PCC 7202]